MNFARRYFGGDFFYWLTDLHRAKSTSNIVSSDAHDMAAWLDLKG
ncbi:Unknown protein sequence [Pseudomonas amygdali pv. lachrymans]|uniref:Uncharacterized protein n=1 Tax=Pseudomonas amygdali pv. lachrymans TaxID=53707 RepID=A0ABR5KNR6_PSEAV|nr:Unknown protein sequence [Pseudomonas amygdali pv. lachrymans]